MSLPPVEIPLGAMRFNSDSQKLEYWSGNAWFQIKTFSPNLDGGGRGLIGGGSDGRVNNIDFITVSTAGNGQDFGDLTQSRDQMGAAASRTRGIWGGGYTPSHSDRIDYVTISSLGDAIDFGNLTQSRKDVDAVSSQTRAVWMAGRVTPSNKNTIDFVTIASTGDAVDFGDMAAAGSNTACYSSPTRGISHNGSFPAALEFITIATTGNAIDFGEPAYERLNQGNGASSATRGLALGGGTSETGIDFIEIASLGNATKFGDLYNGTGDAAGLSDSIRGVLAGGRNPSPETNIIQYVNISTFGDSIDFGDLTYGNNSRSPGGLCNAHGGLG